MTMDLEGNIVAPGTAHDIEPSRSQRGTLARSATPTQKRPLLLSMELEDDEHEDDELELAFPSA